jgi:hypothetical protein
MITNSLAQATHHFACMTYTAVPSIT